MVGWSLKYTKKGGGRLLRAHAFAVLRVSLVIHRCAGRFRNCIWGHLGRLPRGQSWISKWWYFVNRVQHARSSLSVSHVFRAEMTKLNPKSAWLCVAIYGFGRQSWFIYCCAYDLFQNSSSLKPLQGMQFFTHSCVCFSMHKTIRVWPVVALGTRWTRWSLKWWWLNMGRDRPTNTVWTLIY